MTPQRYTRTLEWSGTLTGRPASDLIAWMDGWDPHECSLAIATLNAVLQGASQYRDLIGESTPLGGGNLAVFRAMAAEFGSGRISVIGRYPGLDDVLAPFDFVCIERMPGNGDLPDQAAEYLLPDSEWSFITASALANKTLPRLLELGRASRTVLMGPSLPWTSTWRDWGVDYLAGVEVLDAELLWRVVSEGGGVRIFEDAVGYRLLVLHRRSEPACA
ncbi:hypothetical protein GCM10011352_20800 [Marinobacterium zhoushanense]|uniref:Heavy-metal chelation domain-containing protein n=2 Tax=Marinobacterium zhoushanense TaxID=1679163 RepID=A0ABQ1KBD1_9GAMM|nr:hypothetical protein GCM10011352_20800 [Marinobacterium zhoushanense]